MSYPLIEARLKSLLQSITRFSTVPGAVAIADFNVSNHGYQEAVVFDPGRVELPEAEQTHDGFTAPRTREYDLLFSVFERFVSYSATIPLFEALREDVLDTIENYPTLNGLTMPNVQWVEFVGLTSDGDPYGVYNEQKQGPFHWAQDFRVRYREYRTMGPNLPR